MKIAYPRQVTFVMAYDIIRDEPLVRYDVLMEDGSIRHMTVALPHGRKPEEGIERFIKAVEEETDWAGNSLRSVVG